MSISIYFSTKASKHTAKQTHRLEMDQLPAQFQQVKQTAPPLTVRSNQILASKQVKMLVLFSQDTEGGNYRQISAKSTVDFRRFFDILPVQPHTWNLTQGQTKPTCTKELKFSVVLDLRMIYFEITRLHVDH